MYCVIDCILCNRLMNSMQVLDRNCVLATVSKVPLSYLFLRGQSIKLLSLLFYYCDHCKDTKYLIEDKAIQPGYTQPESESYEGATVLDLYVQVQNIGILKQISQILKDSKPMDSNLFIVLTTMNNLVL